jgi:tRNA pseudouridine13 synthase
MKKDDLINSNIGIWGFSTSQIPGMGGEIKKRPDDFIVREILPNGKILFDGSELGEDIGGMFIHCVLWKSGLDTFSAIRKISKSLKIPKDNFGYAGLKDAFAETYQRISIWNINKEQVKAIKLHRIKLFNPINQKFSVKIGELFGNHFEVTIRDINDPWGAEQWIEFKKHIESKGLLNFYASQRFGSKRPILHLVGKFLLNMQYSEAINTYLGNSSTLENEYISRLRKEYREGHSLNDIKNKFPNSFSIEKKLLEGLERGYSASRTIFGLPKSFLRLAISAYQSYIFNKTLSYLNENKFDFKDDHFIPLPGYQITNLETQPEIWDKMVEILHNEEIDLLNFKQTHPLFRSKGSFRKAKIYPKSLDYISLEISPETIKISFDLPKGSYGTIVTRELIK